MILVTRRHRETSAARSSAHSRRKGAAVRMLVREPARAAGLPPHAARVVADLGEPASLRRAFAGADRHRGLRPDARGHHRTFADWCARHAHAFGRPTAS